MNKLEIVTIEKINKYFQDYIDIKLKNPNKITMEDRYPFADEILENIFKKDRENINLSVIYQKVVLLNSLYYTNIFSTFDMTLHIKKDIKDFKNRINKGDPLLISEIANITIKNKNKNFYSFATKFCFWHNDKMYPIYDRFVAKILKEYSYNNLYDFNCLGIDLKNYEKYRNVINNFCDYFNLPGEVRYRKIDKYLWQKGKELPGE
ncbi:hypothetical protein ES708_25552 [subsurface metagenome]